MKLDDLDAPTTTFLVRFHGVRGSHPVADASHLHYGGNTSCIEIEVAGRRLMVDCGTGAIELGRRLAAEAAGAGVEVLVLVSHAHHDHTMGFPFFAPVYDPASRLHFAGPGRDGRSHREVFEGAFADPFFPVPSEKMPSQRTFLTLDHREGLVWEDGQESPRERDAEAMARGDGAEVTERGALLVRAFRNVRHPNGGVLCFRIEHAGRSVTVATDVEGTEGVDGDLVDFAQGTDLLIHDAQYTDEEYENEKVGWGHSTWRMAADVAWRSGARRLVLHHHDPLHDDQEVERIEHLAREKFPRCVAACEGLEIRL